MNIIYNRVKQFEGDIMISFIRGILVSKKEESIVVECNHIGYEIFVPLSVFSELPSTSNEVKIYTELYVREDILKLYGFLSEEDIDVFKKLISVSGIGPKGALGILSTLTPDALRIAVLTDDIQAISNAKGIGKKTASKLIIELKDKLKPIDLDSLSSITREQMTSNNYVDEAILGLTGLGYSQSEAVMAIKHVHDHSSTESIIKEALMNLAKE